MNVEHTPGPWPIPHMARDDISCNCRYILAGDYCGGIAEIYVGDGKRVADGGNDCPSLDVAKANARLISASPDLLALLVESQSSIGGDWRIRRDTAIAKATGNSS